MISLQETKEFLRVDDDTEDALISSLIVTAKVLVEDVLRRPLADFDRIPEPILQAMLIVTAKNGKYRRINRVCPLRTRSI